MNLPSFLRLSLGLLAFAASALLVAAQPSRVDVIVYGATPGGIAAALAAAKGGRTVLLVEPTIRIGGMTTNGLSHPDFRAFESLTGTYWDLTQRTLAYYKATYGENSPQLKDTFRGTHAEPKVNLLLFQQMLAEHAGITVRTEWTLINAYLRGPTGDRTVRAARFRDAQGGEHVHEAAIFIDGSYEGDLIAAAQIPYRVGVESRDEYNESAAPADGSSDLQGYNFRFVMTQDPANRVPVTAPEGYRREDFLPLLGLITDGKIKRAFGGYRDTDNILKAQIPVLPNNKRDINDVSNGFVRLSLPGDQLMWPEGDAATRLKIYKEHVLWNVGLIYFVQNDPSVPEAFRNEARTWGWCKDEFVESNHIPPQLYVREARRMVGLRIFTQNDTRHAEGDARSVLHRDSIAIGEYGHSSHGVRHEGSRFGGKRFGEGLAAPYAPYQVPYGTIVPKDVRNLLAPVPVSASHVGFCALRLEPIWSSLGQAAGHAAHLALSAGDHPDVRTVPVPKLQRLIHADRGATIYFTDISPASPDFAAAQWWGTLGGFHGLAPKPAGRLLGKQIEGQHSEAWLNHDAELSRPLDAELVQRWLGVAKAAGIATEKLPQADGRATRGDWVRAAFHASSAN
ncbi:MAG TPA: FAD-dependent oxidoreductase [Opitutaceae bacterium]